MGSSFTRTSINQFQISSDVRNRDFVGDIEDVQLHGEPVGLWNAQQAGARKATGARKRERLPDAAVDTSKIHSSKVKRPKSSGISLTGDGYAAYKTGYKRLQKKTMVSLSFLTFAPDGQLLFIGKDVKIVEQFDKSYYAKILDRLHFH